MTSLAKNVAKGAALGAALGLLFIAIGAVRVGIALVSGRNMSPLSSHDARLFAFYVGGFAAAGALLGLAKPLLASRVGTAIGFMLAGIIVVMAIVVGDKGSLSAIHGVDWIVYTLMGMLFGGAAAFGWLRKS